MYLILLNFIPHSESRGNIGNETGAHTRVLELVEDHLRNKVVRDLLSIRLEAANEVGIGLAKCRHQ